MSSLAGRRGKEPPCPAVRPQVESSAGVGATQQEKGALLGRAWRARLPWGERALLEHPE